MRMYTCIHIYIISFPIIIIITKPILYLSTPLSISIIRLIFTIPEYLTIKNKLQLEWLKFVDLKFHQTNFWVY